MQVSIKKLVNNTGQIEGVPANPRQINKEDYNNLLKSLKEDPDFLIHKPLHVYEHNDKYVVLGGNQRLRALKELGYEEVPVTVYDKTTPVETLKARIIKDNSAFGEYDFDMLGNEWSDEPLTDWGMDLPEDWLDQEPEIEEDEAPEVDESEPPKSKLGEIYQLGRHRVMCGDSLDVESVSELLEGGKADMVFTDPPYGVSYTGGLQNTNKGLKGNARQMINNDDIDLYEEAVSICAMFSKGPVFMFYADTVPFGLYRGIEKVKGDIVALIIWKKKGGYGALGASYKANHEPCLLWKPKGTNLNFVGSTTENRIWEIDKEGLNKLHPTQKPVSVPARAIKNHSANTVLDLFLGSGSTLIACEQTDRTCYGMELDPKYVDVIRKRYHKFVTGSEEGWENETPAI